MGPKALKGKQSVAAKKTVKKETPGTQTHEQRKQVTAMLTSMKRDEGKGLEGASEARDVWKQLTCQADRQSFIDKFLVSSKSGTKKWTFAMELKQTLSKDVCLGQLPTYETAPQGVHCTPTLLDPNCTTLSFGLVFFS
eukprot:6491666-Amphidinium_carterae.2